MIELTVVRGPGQGSSITLTPDRSVSIGSAAEAELRVGGSGVAERHVVVKPLKDGGFGVKALAGDFGHNGDAVAAARLRPGDVLRVGDSEIRCTEANGALRELGGFRLLGVLGRGGWGTVWRAEQISLRREVALKVLSQERTSDPVFVGRFQAEARHAARLHHPHVVQVFDVDHDADTWFYSMELMHGGSLEQRLKRDGKLPVEEAIRAVREAADGLAFAEQMRIVHRDIKPDNLMVDRHGHVKLADLGLAMTDEDAETKLVGTPHFMSPEQVRKQSLDHRSDLYSLGCTFYRLTTGRTPFQGSSSKQILRAHIEEQPVPANEVEPTVPAAVAQVIDRLMQKEPDARHQSASELIADLDRLLAAPARRGPGLAIAGLVLLLAAALVVVLVSGHEDSKSPEIIEKIVSDPDAERALIENRRIEAENALLRVRMQQLEGPELATALEAIATEHAGTPAADQAAEQATSLREAERARAAEAEQMQRRVDAAQRALRDGFEDAFEADDLPRAAGMLAGGPSDPELASQPALVALRDELQARLLAAASTRIDALRAQVEAAVAQRDPDGIRSAAAAIEALVGEGGWPDLLFADRGELASYAAERLARAAAIEDELGDAARRAAWTELQAIAFDGDGLLAAVATLRFADAAAELEDFAQRHDGLPAGLRAAALAPSLRAAEAYVARLTEAAEPSPIEDPRRGQPVVLRGFARETGLTIAADAKPRTATEVITPAMILEAPADWLPKLDGAEQERHAAIGWIALRAAVDGARDYLGTLRADDDASGTGPHAFHAAEDTAPDAARCLAEASPAWAEPLIAELQAAALLRRGLVALAGRRNLTAASLVERALTEHPDTFVVRCLR